MDKSSDTRLIGLFVLGGIALTVAGVLIFGGGRYFSGASTYVAYFPGSVSGLNIGAPVKLKGVSIGRVNDIFVQYDTTQNRALTPVVLQIDFGKVQDVGGASGNRRADLEALVARGLRARLSLQSLVTAQVYVDLGFFPDRKAEFVARHNHNDRPEIPTIPSDREELEVTIQSAVTRFRQLPLEETVAAALLSLRKIEQILSDPETRAGIANMNRTLRETQHLVGHLDSKVDRLAGDFDSALAESRDLMKTLRHGVSPLLASAESTLSTVRDSATQAKTTLATVDEVSRPNAELRATLKDLSKAARSVRALADFLVRNPQTLLLGRQAKDD